MLALHANRQAHWNKLDRLTVQSGRGKVPEATKVEAMPHGILGDPMVLERPAASAKARAMEYRQRAVELRELAENPSLVEYTRDRLLDLAEQFDQLATSVERY